MLNKNAPKKKMKERILGTFKKNFFVEKLQMGKALFNYKFYWAVNVNHYFIIIMKMNTHTPLFALACTIRLSLIKMNI